MRWFVVFRVIFSISTDVSTAMKKKFLKKNTWDNTHVGAYRIKYACATLSCVLIVGACGGDGKIDDISLSPASGSAPSGDLSPGSSSTPLPSASVPSSPEASEDGVHQGALVFNESGRIVRFNLEDGAISHVSLEPGTNPYLLGYGGGAYTNFVSEYTEQHSRLSLFKRRYRSDGFELQPDLGYRINQIGVPGLFISRVQPSPDEAWLSFATYQYAAPGGSFKNYLYIMRAADSQTYVLPDYTESLWLDAQTLIASRLDGLFSVHISGTAVAPTESRIGPVGLARPGANAAVQYPSASPDGKVLAFVQDGAVWKMNIDGTNMVQLTKSASPHWPSWRSDGKYLVVLSEIDGHDCTKANPEHPPRAKVIRVDQSQQDLSQAPALISKDGRAIQSCGPVYWTASQPDA